MESFGDFSTNSTMSTGFKSAPGNYFDVGAKVLALLPLGIYIVRCTSNPLTTSTLVMQVFRLV